MTKICEVCRKDVKQPPSKRGLPQIYVMYSSMDVAIIEDGSEQHIYTHTMKYICPKCRIENKAQWLQMWKDSDRLRGSPR